MFDFIKQNPILWAIVFLLIVSPSLLFGAFQVIAIIILVIVVLAVIAGLFLRWKVFNLQKEMGKRAQNGSSTYSSNYRSNPKNSGDVDVKIYASQTEKKVKDDVGDYVDFEEVKEK